MEWDKEEKDMGMMFNPGNEMFQRAVKSEIYVDKSGLLAVTNRLLGTENCFLCISRPRRFGKSMALNMLCAYYSKGCDSGELFSRFQIAKEESFAEHLNKYHVIQLNMKKILNKSDTILGAIGQIVKEIGFDIEEDLEGIRLRNPEDLSQICSDIYRQTKTAFVFLIDEWDAVFRVKGWGSSEQKEYLDFLEDVLKDQPYVALAYMTGILPIKKYGEHSALNMFTEYSMTESVPISEYMGFTTAEVQALSEAYGISYDMVQAWYDGYLIDEKEMYNPRSVVQVCMKKKFDSYWTKTETYEALKIYIEMNFDGLRDTVVKLLAGERAVIDMNSFTNDMVTFVNKDDVMTLLVHLGYLTYDFDTREVFIPNQEIAGEFASTIKVLGWSEVADALKQSDELLRETIQGNGTKVAEILEKIHRSETSIMAYNDENALASVISLAYYSARRNYVIYRELPSGDGYADLTFIPRKHTTTPAMVVELKVNQTVETALSQIKKKHYTEGLKDYQGEVLLVGISYDREKKEHRCEIEKVEKELCD